MDRAGVWGKLRRTVGEGGSECVKLPVSYFIFTVLKLSRTQILSRWYGRKMYKTKLAKCHTTAVSKVMCSHSPSFRIGVTEMTPEATHNLAKVPDFTIVTILNYPPPLPHGLVAKW